MNDMNNNNKKYFVDAISEETVNKLTEEMEEMLNSQHKPAKKKFTLPLKMITSFAALVVLIGVINIQTVIAFIGGLFFVPHIGMTDDDTISSFSIDEPIEVAEGLTLQFMTKITQDNKSDLIFYINTASVPNPQDADDPDQRSAIAFQNMQNLIVKINIDGETLDVPCTGGTGGGGITNYSYTFADFPDANEFDFTILGVTTHITLSEQNNNFAISKENHGITLILHKFPRVTSFIGVDVIDSNIVQDDYYITVDLWHFDSKLHGENGEEIEITGGSSSSDGGLRFNLAKTENNDNNIEVKSLKANAVQLRYSGVREKQFVIEIPIPKDGETIKTDSQVTIAGHTYRITEVRRDGDTLYYKDDARWDESFNLVYDNPAKYQEAIEKNEAYVVGAMIMPPPNTSIGGASDGEWHSWEGLDMSVESIECPVWFLDVVYFGDFDIAFE